MNKEEFTEAFDLERFKAGEPALSKHYGFDFARYEIDLNEFQIGVK